MVNLRPAELELHLVRVRGQSLAKRTTRGACRWARRGLLLGSLVGAAGVAVAAFFLGKGAGTTDTPTVATTSATATVSVKLPTPTSTPTSTATSTPTSTPTGEKATLRADFTGATPTIRMQRQGHRVGST